MKKLFITVVLILFSILGYANRAYIACFGNQAYVINK